MTTERHLLLADFYRTLISLERMIGPSHDEFLKEFGLTGAQAQLLYFLDKQSPCNVKDVAGCMCTTSGAATQLIEGLVQMGIIERASSESDRRYVKVCLTQPGAKFLKGFKQAHAKHLARLLEPIADADLAYATELRDKVASHIASLKAAA